MLGSRRGRPSIIGRTVQTAARTAVIVGTANAVTNKMSRAPAAAPADATPAAAAPAGLTDESIAQLKKLAELQEAGILTAEEFAQQKARILG